MDTGTINRIVELSQTGRIIQPAGGYFPMAVEGDKLISIEKFCAQPYHINEDLQLPSLKALTDYLSAFKKPNTAVFANSATQKLQAVLDYHERPNDQNGPEPSWCKHKVGFSLNLDEDFAHFLKLDKRFIEQDDLVIELTDYAPNFIVPSAADILGLVGDVQLIDNKELASKVGSGGLSTLYKQDKKLAARGSTQFPEVFKVLLPVFKGYPQRYEIPFRLLWKCGEETRNKLVFQMRLVRPHAILEAAFQDVCEQVKIAVPGIALYGADQAGTSKTI